MTNFNWGIDANGCCHICAYDNPAVLFCGLKGVAGMLVVDYYLELRNE